MSFNFNNETPIYLQIIEEIKLRIINGKYEINQKIPSVRDLAMEFEVNPNTIVKAMAELENLNLIYTDSTNGKFVTTNKDIINNTKNLVINKIINDFLQNIKQLGLSGKEIIENLKGRE